MKKIELQKCVLNALMCATAVMTVAGPAGRMARAAEEKAATTAVAQPSEPAVSTVTVADVQRANQEAARRLQTAENHWKAKLAALGSKESLKKFAKEIGSLEDKFQQVSSLVGSPGSQTDHLRTAFRKHVASEQKLADEMSCAFQELQEQLLQESIALYMQAGLDRDAAFRAVKLYQVDPAVWRKAFDPLLAKARSMSQEDWWRSGLKTASSFLAADAVTDAGRQAGVLKTEEGGIFDLISTLAVQLFVDAVIDTVTDPTEDFAKKLDAYFRNAEHELLYGRAGLIPAMRFVTEQHQQARGRHFGLAAEGGR